MIRPPYPPVCHESEFSGNTEKPLWVIHGCWKVGDLVDWCQDDCYWSGTIMEMMEDEVVQMELIPPPYGQGENYKAMCSDLRPSLEWSPVDGWKLPSMIKLLLKREKCQLNHELLKLTEKKHELLREPFKSYIFPACEIVNERRVKQHELKGEGELRLNIMESDSIEAAIYDLEELIVRIEWIKDMLSPDGERGSESSWIYEDHRPSSSGM
ncbi:unnamed protein product [Cochlearia groenlandica]